MQANQDLAQACLEHPFVQGIADGTLHRKNLPTMWDKMPFLPGSPVHTALRQRKLLTVRDWYHALTGGVLEEIHLHEGHAAAWGVNLRLLNWNQQHVVILTLLLATAW